jgi:hypothetical protein
MEQKAYYVENPGEAQKWEETKKRDRIEKKRAEKERIMGLVEVVRSNGIYSGAKSDHSSSRQSISTSKSISRRPTRNISPSYLRNSVPQNERRNQR